MNLRHLTALLTTATIAGAVVSALCVGSGSHGVQKLAAEEADPLADTDGDLLPDSLEWVTLTDPGCADTDRDGVDDFLQTVQHRGPGSTVPRPVQDEVRVLVSSAKNGQETDFYVHMLFRFVGNRIGNVQQMTPFITVGTTNPVSVPIMALIGSGRLVVRSNYTPATGTYIAISARIARSGEIAALLPATIGASATIDGRDYTSGSYVAIADNQLVAFVPVEGSFLAQPINGGEGANNPYWNSNSVCMLKMNVVGSGLAGSLCEVNAAECEVANGLRCAPSCRGSVGKLVFVPDGLGTLTGG